MGTWGKPPRQVKDATFEPGFDTFLKFIAHTHQNLKPPPRKELVEAFRIFFDYKKAHKTLVNTTQALSARIVLESLLRDRSEEPVLELSDLECALSAIAPKHRIDRSEDHIIMAKLLYEEIKMIKFPTHSERTQNSYEELCSDSMERLIIALTRCGAPDDAAEVLSKFKSHTPRFDLSKHNKLAMLHMRVIRAYGKTPYHSGLGCSPEQWKSRPIDYAAELLDAGFSYTTEFHENMVIVFADHGDEGNLRTWFEKPIENEKMASEAAYNALVSFSSRTGCHPEWLRAAMQQLCNSNPPNPWWNVILKWALSQGKDVDHIKQMIKVISQLDREGGPFRADIHTINLLLAAAIDTKNALAAERVNALASELGLRPNPRTYALLLEARIMGQDDMGAATVFDDLVHSVDFRPGSLSNNVANMYIRYLCSRKATDSNDIATTVGHIEQQHGTLGPETIMALCLRFLKDDKIMDVIDTLSIHLKLLSLRERGLVQSELLNYSLDESVSTARAWDCYSLIRQFFPETSREQRMRLMEGFFGRKRADMACIIFGHMRSHPDDDIRPDLEAYVACLEGLGAYPDAESLSMVHNMLKMDSMIQPNTRLYNAFMIAYTGCGGPQRAFDFWQQISNSADGPTHKSLELAFRACQKLPYGYEKAQAIWDKLRKLEVDVPLHVYDAYILMAAGQGKLGRVKNLLLTRQATYDADLEYIQ